MIGHPWPDSRAERRGVKIPDTPELEIVIEVPRGSFLKRGSTGTLDFISPLPCPFNYGAVPAYLGLEGDLLDAVVLGPRLGYGSRVRMRPWGAIALTDRGMTDHKLVFSREAPSARQQLALLRFFDFYAYCKGLLNLVRRRPGRNGCDGWISAQQALDCARPRNASWRGAPVPY